MRNYILILSLFLLTSCASNGVVNEYGQQSSNPWEDFTKGSARLSCGVSCSYKDGSFRPRYKAAHNSHDWKMLATSVMNIGYSIDRNYVYLGKAAESLGMNDAAEKYYQLAQNHELKCRGFINVCDGIDVHAETSTGLARVRKLQDESSVELMAGNAVSIGAAEDNSLPNNLMLDNQAPVNEPEPAPVTFSSHDATHESKNHTNTKHVERPTLKIAAIDHHTLKGKNRWTVKTREDAITDEKVVNAILSESEGGSQSLVVRCESGKLQVYVNFKDYLTDSILITSRIDKQKPSRSLWSTSTDNNAAFYPHSEKQLVRSLISAGRFVVRGIPYNEDPVTAIFNVSGLYQALYEKRYECFVRTGIFSSEQLNHSKPRVVEPTSGAATKNRVTPPSTPEATLTSIEESDTSVPGLELLSIYDSNDPEKRPFSIPLSNIESFINDTDSADGIVYDIVVEQGVMKVDLKLIPGKTSMAAVTRTIWIMGRLAERKYKEMWFIDKGVTLYKISALELQRIGRQFIWGEAGKGQNPIALNRQFAGALVDVETGKKAAILTGSLLGDTSRSVDAINTFNRRWVIEGDKEII